jgi:ankyrin repeat protein
MLQDRLWRAYFDVQQRVPRLPFASETTAMEAVEMIRQAVASMRTWWFRGLLENSSPSAAVLERLLPAPFGAVLFLPNDSTFLASDDALRLINDNGIKLVQLAAPLLHSFGNPASCATTLAQLCLYLVSIRTADVTGIAAVQAVAKQLLEVCRKMPLTPLPAACTTLDAALRSRPALHDLISACWRGEVTGAEAAIAAGARVTASVFECPLVIAATFGHTSLVSMLLTHMPREEDGTWAQVAQGQINAALDRAVAMGHPDVVSALLFAKAPTNAAGGRNDSSLALAAGGNADVTVVLARHGISTIPSHVFERGLSHDVLTQLQYACMAGTGDEVTRALASLHEPTWESLCACIQSDVKAGAPASPLSLAVIAHNVVAVDALLRHPLVRANIDWQDGQGMAALHYAALGEGIRAANIIALLGAAGANANLSAGIHEGWHSLYPQAMLRLWSSSPRSSEEVGRALLAIGASPVIDHGCSCQNGDPHRGHVAFQMLGGLYNAPKVSVLLEGLSHEELHAEVPEILHGFKHADFVSRHRKAPAAVLADRIRATNSPAMCKVLSDNISYSRRQPALLARAHDVLPPTAPQKKPLHQSFGLLRAARNPTEAGLEEDMAVLNASIPSNSTTTCGTHRDLKVPHLPLLYGIPRSAAVVLEEMQTAPVYDVWQYMGGLTPAAICYVYHVLFNYAPNSHVCKHLTEVDRVAVAKRIARTVLSGPATKSWTLMAVQHLECLLGAFPGGKQQLLPEILRLFADVLPCIAEDDEDYLLHQNLQLFRVYSPDMRRAVAASVEASGPPPEEVEGRADLPMHVRAHLFLLTFLAHKDPEAVPLLQSLVSQCKHDYLKYTLNGQGWRLDDEGVVHTRVLPMCYTLSISKEAASTRPQPPESIPESCPDKPVSGGHYMDVPCATCEEPMQALLDIDLTDERMRPLYDALGGKHDRLRVPHCCKCFCDTCMEQLFCGQHMYFDLETGVTDPANATDDDDEENHPYLGVGCITLGENVEGVSPDDFCHSTLGGVPRWNQGDLYPTCNDPECGQEMVCAAMIDGESIMHPEGQFIVFVCTACCRTGSFTFEGPA